MMVIRMLLTFKSMQCRRSFASWIKRKKKWLVSCDSDTVTDRHFCLSLLSACLCELRFTPPTESLLITNGQTEQISLPRFQCISMCGVFVWTCLIGKVPQPSTRHHAQPLDLCKPVPRGSRMQEAPPPTQTFFQPTGLTGWRLPFSALSAAPSSLPAHLLGPHQPQLPLQTSNVLCLEPQYRRYS